MAERKIVKDENYKPDDDELDDNMHSFLVEALNDSYKLRSVRTVIKNPKEYTNEKVKIIFKILGCTHNIQFSRTGSLGC